MESETFYIKWYIDERNEWINFPFEGPVFFEILEDAKEVAEGYRKILKEKHYRIYNNKKIVFDNDNIVVNNVNKASVISRFELLDFS